MGLDPVAPHLGITDVYDGTNGEEVADQADVIFVADDGTTLTVALPVALPNPPPIKFVGLNRRILWEMRPDGKHFLGLVHPTFDAEYVKITQLDEIEIIAANVAQSVAETVLANVLDDALVISTGSDTLAAGGLLGQTQVLDITVTPELPNTDLVAMTRKRGAPGLLSGHGITEVEVINTTTVRVTVVSGIGAPAGASVHVFVPWLDPQTS